MNFPEDFSILVSLCATILSLLTSVISWYKFLGRKRVLSAWMIPRILDKDDDLRDIQERLLNLGLLDLSNIVRKDREYRLRRVYSREVRGEEIASSVDLLTMITTVILCSVSFAGSFFDDRFVSVLILALFVIIIGASLSFGLKRNSLSPWKRNLIQVGAENPRDPLDPSYGIKEVEPKSPRRENSMLNIAEFFRKFLYH